MTEEELIATVLEKAPREYSTVLTCEQRVKGTALTMIDLAEAMNQLWRTMNSGTEDRDKEMSLMSKDGVTCYKCGKKEHKTFECRTKCDEKKGKFDGKCSTSGERGTKLKTAFRIPRTNTRFWIGIRN